MLSQFILELWMTAFYCGAVIESESRRCFRKRNLKFVFPHSRESEIFDDCNDSFKFVVSFIVSAGQKKFQNCQKEFVSCAITYRDSNIFHFRQHGWRITGIFLFCALMFIIHRLITTQGNIFNRYFRITVISSVQQIHVLKTFSYLLFFKLCSRTYGSLF